MRFGGVMAVDSLHIHVYRRELVGLIGPNGAGKTTVFNAVTGVYPPSRGKIAFNGWNIVGWGPHSISAAGIARTFQNIRLFKELTVLDNVRLACHKQIGYGVLSALLRLPRFRESEAAITKRSVELLGMLGLADNANELACSLPYGQQRRLELARALATSPSLLLLDEPVAGMNHEEKLEVELLIRRVREEFDLTVLLIEHDMPFVMSLCERLVVLDHGEVIAEGIPDEVRGNPEVIRAYLGDENHA